MFTKSSFNQIYNHLLWIEVQIWSHTYKETKKHVSPNLDEQIHEKYNLN